MILMTLPSTTLAVSCNATITDTQAQEILEIWQTLLPGGNAVLLLLASETEGSPVITHGMLMPQLRINGLLSVSPLSNNALYSWECAEAIAAPNCTDKILNLYEVMIPDIPAPSGGNSTAEFYANCLREHGMSVAGTHFHWWGSTIFQNDHLIAAIHHQSSELTASQFSVRTIECLTLTQNLIDERAIPYITPSSDADEVLEQVEEAIPAFLRSFLKKH